MTALAALATPPVGPITIDGHPPLRRRPFGPLHEALAQLGVSVTPGETFGSLPATIDGPPSDGSPSIRGDVSSQYVTALMLIGPYLPGGLRLQLTSGLISRPYVELTAFVMGWFDGTQIEIGDDLITVAPGEYRRQSRHDRARCLVRELPAGNRRCAGGAVQVDGLGDRALQGDARFADLLAEMGCTVERDEHRFVSAAPAVCAASISTCPTTPTWFRRWPSSLRSPTRRAGSVASASSVTRRAIGSAT